MKIELKLFRKSFKTKQKQNSKLKKNVTQTPLVSLLQKENLSLKQNHTQTEGKATVKRMLCYLPKMNVVTKKNKKLNQQVCKIV